MLAGYANHLVGAYGRTLSLARPSHQRLGSLLCERWSLPRQVQQACEFHEPEQLRLLSEERTRDTFLEVVCVSNMLTNLASTRLTTELRTEIVAEARKPLDCSEDQFLLLMGEIYELKNEVGNFLRDL